MSTLGGMISWISWLRSMKNIETCPICKDDTPLRSILFESYHYRCDKGHTILNEVELKKLREEK